MTSTFTNYQLVARDLPKALQRKAADPVVARDTAYYEANIGKVKSVDDLMADQRLYAYAMKAYGLEDMTYAKAFMRKVLEGGVADASSFANRLADPRYVAFARAFDFAAGAASASGADGSISESGVVPPQPAQLTAPAALPDSTDFSGANEARFTLTSRLDATTTRSVTITLNAATLAGSAADLTRVTGAEIVAAINAQIAASGEDGLEDRVQVGLGARNELYFETTASAPDGFGTAVEAGGTGRTLSVENAAPSAADRKAVGIGFGTALPPDAQVRTVTDAYLEQTLESDAGEEDTGLRLALYFARMAPTLTSAYDILGDAALSKVANTVAGLPATSGAATSEALDARAAFLAAKIDIAGFQDPAKVQAFVRRFAAIWDAQNSSGDSPILALFTTAGGGGADPLGSLYPTNASS
ncbi:protein of unknown function DUF1217 [Methylobacterium sp. 4-46]|uniref:DUF1217 domain-containing protein n=1 Tax=Methylobacterium sp. (strain 4-46) TaxID=426117 RepID=UPI000152C40A|nr:DUF1217 domain-containing protein [Methylobacterium sp. 4-46]ACA20761.1 protein of unknown function DUF1217 [Methylobacterium sp. 4-46]